MMYRITYDTGNVLLNRFRSNNVIVDAMLRIPFVVHCNSV